MGSDQRDHHPPLSIHFLSQLRRIVRLQLTPLRAFDPMASGTTAQRSSATASAHPWSIHPLQRHRLRSRRLPPPPRRKSCVAITSAAGTQQSLSGVSTMQEAYDLLTDRVMHHLQRRGDSR